MRLASQAGVALSVLLASALLAGLAPDAARAAFGVQSFFAGNCVETAETCGEHAKHPTTEEAEEQGYRQAGGHPPFGITDFVLNSNAEGFPEGSIKRVRVDVSPGIVTNPQAVPKCSMQDFTGGEVAEGVFTEGTCPESSVIGEQVAVVVPAAHTDITLTGIVYNLEPENGLASEFGVALSLANVGEPGYFSHTLIKGSVEWASDYHDYVRIENISKTLPLLESRLIFIGNAEGTPGFLRNPSVCPSAPGPETTSTVEVESYEGAKSTVPYELPVGTNGCEHETFDPTFSLTPEGESLRDQPDGVTVEVKEKHPPAASETDVSDLRTATITMPEGLTINPSAAAGLEGCEPDQIGIGTRKPVTCPSRSQIGTVQLEVPTLPPGSLQGAVFLGKPKGQPITGPPYTIYLDAESARFGISVRLEGTVEPQRTDLPRCYRRRHSD